MITPKLEELIWEGRAQYKTWTIGSGAAGLNVKNNQTVIILAVDYFGFLDSGEVLLTPVALWREKMNKQITFYSKKRRFNLLARSFFSSEGLLSSHHTFDTYFVFEENILCNIGSFEPVANWNFIVGQAPLRSEQPLPPLGLGNENGGFGSPNVVLEMEFNTSQSDDEAVPYPDTRPTKDTAYHDFQTAFSTDSQLLIPGQNADNLGELQYPMLTVHYVEINERLTAKFA